jgi:hypothetical protein
MMLYLEREMRNLSSKEENKNLLDKLENLRKFQLLELRVLIQLKLEVMDCLRKCQLLSLEKELNLIRDSLSKKQN